MRALTVNEIFKQRRSDKTRKNLDDIKKISDKQKETEKEDDDDDEVNEEDES